MRALLATSQQDDSFCTFTTKGAAIHRDSATGRIRRGEPGATPQESDRPDNQALMRVSIGRWLLNPKHTARRNQRCACKATRGIPLER